MMEFGPVRLSVSCLPVTMSLIIGVPEKTVDRNFVVICQIHGDDRGAEIASNNFLPPFGKAIRLAMVGQPRSSMTLGWHIFPLDCDERL